jgi:hypothetical protein
MADPKVSDFSSLMHRQIEPQETLVELINKAKGSMWNRVGNRILVCHIKNKSC